MPRCDFRSAARRGCAHCDVLRFPRADPTLRCMIRTILAAVDSSPRAASVAAAAADLAMRFGARAVLLRVIEFPQEFPPAAAHGRDPLPPLIESSAKAALQQLSAAHPGLEIDPPLVYEGQPWRAILERARELDADLIVIGSHGYSGWDRILGTTAGKVVNHSDRSVLVVHEHPPHA